MAGNRNNIEIDEEKLFNWLDSRPETAAVIAESIGKSRTYFTSMAKLGHMPKAVYDLIVRLYELPEDIFLPDDEEEEEEEEEPAPVVSTREGYWVDLKIAPDKVCFTLNFSSNGADLEVAHAWSNIKSGREQDLVQAISYAAHMVYKIVEQQNLSK